MLHRLHAFPHPFLIGIACLLLAGSACTRDNSTHQVTPAVSGSPTTTSSMPPLETPANLGWVLHDGKRATFADYRGKVLVLDFYATWCAPCRQSIPRLNALGQNYGAGVVQVVGLNVGGPDDRIKVAAFAKELKIQYPLGFPDKALTDFFLSDNQTIPQTFVFARDGHQVRRFIGYEEATGVELEKVIGETVSSNR